MAPHFNFLPTKDGDRDMSSYLADVKRNKESIALISTMDRDFLEELRELLETHGKGKYSVELRYKLDLTVPPKREKSSGKS